MVCVVGLQHLICVSSSASDSKAVAMTTCALQYDETSQLAGVRFDLRQWCRARFGL